MESLLMEMPTTSSLLVPTLSSPAPPSENEMATWLYPIFRGEETVAGEGQPSPVLGNCLNDKSPAPAAKESSDKFPSTEGRCTSQSSEETSSKSNERTRTATGARRSHHPETHSVTEKRRRRKINEKLKTLQQLVPGCAKSNHASTLDQTIQYMKSLQHQVQHMKPASAGPTTVYPVPVVQQPYLQPPPAAAGTAGLPTMQLAAGPGMTMLARGHVRPGAVVLGPSPAIVPVSPMMAPFVHHPAAAFVMPVAPPTMPASSYPDVAPQRPCRESRRKGN